MYVLIKLIRYFESYQPCGGSKKPLLISLFMLESSIAREPQGDSFTVEFNRTSWCVPVNADMNKHALTHSETFHFSDIQMSVLHWYM